MSEDVREHYWDQVEEILSSQYQPCDDWLMFARQFDSVREALEHTPAGDDDWENGNAEGVRWYACFLGIKGFSTDYRLGEQLLPEEVDNLVDAFEKLRGDAL